MAKREYIRMDPEWAEKLEAKGYPDGAIVAFAKVLGAAEAQNPRGSFKNSLVLGGHLGKHRRWIAYLVRRNDLTTRPDGYLYVDGWDEWQEGDWKVSERVARIRNRPKGSLNSTTATVTQDTVQSVTEGTTATVSTPSDRNRKTVTVSREPRADARETADGLTTEEPDVQAYVERWMRHAGQPSALDLEFFRRVPYECSRLSRQAVLEEIERLADRFLGKSKPMPPASYLGGRLADLQGAASDSGVRPQSRPRSNMTRIRDVLKEA